MITQQRIDAFMADFNTIARRHGLTLEATIEPNMIGTYQNGVKPSFRVVEMTLPTVAHNNPVTTPEELSAVTSNETPNNEK